MIISDFNLGWVCGIIDGESVIDINRLERTDKKGVTKYCYKASIRIGMEDYNTIKKLQVITEMGRVYQTAGKPHQNKKLLETGKKPRKPFYLLYFNELETEILLQHINGKLTTKQKDLEILQSYYKSTNKDEIFFEMRSIKRGTDKKKARKKAS